MVVVHSAGRQDHEGALYVFWRVRCWLRRLKLVWADSAYAGRPVEWAARFCKFALEIVRRPEEAKGFVLVKRRWIVERTLGWLVRWRRLVKDYEFLPETSETMVYLAMTGVMLNRLKPRPKKPGTR